MLIFILFDAFLIEKLEYETIIIYQVRNSWACNMEK